MCMVLTFGLEWQFDLDLLLYFPDAKNGFHSPIQFLFLHSQVNWLMKFELGNVGLKFQSQNRALL